jgi:uncharacterized membrane protein YjfL (UPF0719 family)
MERYLMIGLYMLMILVFLFFTKKAADAITNFDDDMVIEREANLAVALRRFGLYIGACIAMAGVMREGITRVDIILFLEEASLVAVIFFVAQFINDYVIVPGVRNNDLIAQGNVPVGLIEAGSFIATGILLNGAFMGEEGGMLPAVVFFFLGQVMMAAAIWIHQKVYRFNVTECAKASNMAGGVTVSGLLIAYSLILRTSISGTFTGWPESLGYFLISAATGMICLILFEKLAGIIFLPKTIITEDIKNGNTASILLVQGVTIALSLIISRLV